MQPRGKEPPDFPPEDHLAADDGVQGDGPSGGIQHEQQGPDVNVTMQRTGRRVFSVSRLRVRVGQVLEAEGQSQGSSRQTALIAGLTCELGAGGLWILNSAAGITVSVLVAVLVSLYFVVER